MGAVPPGSTRATLGDTGPCHPCAFTNTLISGQWAERWGAEEVTQTQPDTQPCVLLDNTGPVLALPGSHHCSGLGWVGRLLLTLAFPREAGAWHSCGKPRHRRRLAQETDGKLWPGTAWRWPTTDVHSPPELPRLAELHRSRQGCPRRLPPRILQHQP